jgi:hypothetical protein
MTRPPTQKDLWVDRNRNVPTEVIERFLANARAGKAEWEVSVKDYTRRLATAVDRVYTETVHIQEYETVLKARRETEKDE